MKRFDAWDLTGALEAIWELMRWLNRQVEQTALAARQGRGPGSRARRGALRPGRRRARGRGRALPVPAANRAADPRSARPAGVELELERIAVRPDSGDRRDRRGRAALPAGRSADRRGVTDTHAHLDACAQPADELVARALEAGVDRMSRSGRVSIRAARTLAIAGAARRCLRRARDPSAPGREPDATRLDELRELLAGERAVAVGETGLDFYRDYAPHDRQRELFERAAGAGRRARQDRSSSHARGSDDDRRRAEGVDGHRRPALLLGARAARRSRSSAATTSRSPQRHLPEGRRAAPGGARRPGRAAARRDRRPVSRAQPRRGRPNEPANVVHTVAALAEARGEDPPRARRPLDADASAAFGLDEPARRRRRSSASASLVDENLLGVIGRLAELDPRRGP